MRKCEPTAEWSGAVKGDGQITLSYTMVMMPPPPHSNAHCLSTSSFRTNISCMQPCTELCRSSRFSPEEVSVKTQISEWETLQFLGTFPAWPPCIQSVVIQGNSMWEHSRRSAAGSTANEWEGGTDTKNEKAKRKQISLSEKAVSYPKKTQTKTGVYVLSRKIMWSAQRS